MKRINHILILALLALCSCSKDDDTPSVTQQSSSGITIALKTTGQDETEYIVSKRDIMSGTITSEGTGVEQTGWRFYHPVGKTLFASGYSADNQCAGYASNGNGLIEKKGEFIFENALELFGQSEDEKTLLAMEIPRVGFANRRLHFIDVASVHVKKIVGTKIFADETNNVVAWPTALKVRGGKLFIPFQKLDSEGNFTTPEANEAFVAVYPYPNVGAEPEKIISDPRTSNIGVNGTTTGLIEADNGDLYSFSCGATMAGFHPAATKPSGILRIKSGETEFDPNYFFNVEEATNGGKLFWFDYVGNNKAIARILTNDNGNPWDAFTRNEVAFNQKLVIVDLEAKTVTDVANIPLHAKRYSSPVLVEEGKVYVSIETETKAHVYQVNMETATGIKGAEIIGKTIKGFYKL